MSELAKQRVLAAVGAAVLACATQATGCGLFSGDPAQPCNGLVEGDRLMLTIAQQHPISPPEPSTTTCNDELADLPLGFTFEAVLTEFEPGKSGSDHCLSGRATITRTDDWTWQVPAASPRPAGSHAVEARFDASRGTCRGTVDVRLSGNIPAGVPAAGMRASATLSRLFLRTAGSDRCPMSCLGEFGVAATKR